MPRVDLPFPGEQRGSLWVEQRWTKSVLRAVIRPKVLDRPVYKSLTRNFRAAGGLI